MSSHETSRFYVDTASWNIVHYHLVYEKQSLPDMSEFGEDFEKRKTLKA
jgi:hypothetical protein